MGLVKVARVACRKKGAYYGRKTTSEGYLMWEIAPLQLIRLSAPSGREHRLLNSSLDFLHVVVSRRS